MAIEAKAILKAYFETGDTPTEAQFINLIDTLFGGMEEYVSINANHTITTETLVFGTGNITVTLPTQASRIFSGSQQPITIKNIGSGTITLSELIEGDTDILAGESWRIATNGTNWYVV